MKILLRRWVVVVTIVTLALVLLAVARASAVPAIWVVETPTSKVYLFGTVHGLKPGMSWHSAVMDAALAESRDLWIEVANADDVAAIPDQPLMRKTTSLCQQWRAARSFLEQSRKRPIRAATLSCR